MDQMIQDIFPSCYQVAYQPRPPKPEDKCFFFRGRTVLERWDGEALVLPDYAAVAAHIGQPQFLFIIDETAYYLAEYPNALESPEGYEWNDLRHERSKKSRVLCFAEATAYHLAERYGANRFCGQCGERTQPDADANLLLGFFARLDGPSAIHLDRQELSQAGWYHRDEIDLPPDGVSLTNHMIQAFRRGEWD